MCADGEHQLPSRVRSRAFAPLLRWRRGLERPAAEAEEMKREDGARRDAIGRNHEEFAY